MALPDCAFFSDHSKAESAFLSLPRPAVFLFGNRLVRFRRGFRPRSFHGTCFLQSHSLSSGLHRRHLLGTLLQRGKTVHTIQQYRAYLLFGYCHRIVASQLRLWRTFPLRTSSSLSERPDYRDMLWFFIHPMGSRHTTRKYIVSRHSILFHAHLFHSVHLLVALRASSTFFLVRRRYGWPRVRSQLVGDPEKMIRRSCYDKQLQMCFYLFQRCLFRDDCMSKSILRSA